MLSPELVRCALESAPDAMVIIDASGQIVFANHQVTTLFGHRLEDMLGQGIEGLMPERFRSRHLGHRRQYLESGRPRPMGAGLDLFALRADGTEFPVEISLSPIREGSQVLTAAAIRDVSEGVAVERELKEARAEAERANSAKSRFLATASHDLRQPLQALSLLHATLQPLLPRGEGAEALAQQGHAIQAMSHLLNALLDISKFESGAIEPTIADFAIATLLEELRSEFASLAKSKGLAFEAESCEETVYSDPSLLGQILRNLLANAIKYTERGFVALACHRDGDAVRIEVRDSGIGIGAQDLAHIYDEFYQVGIAANSSRDGYGLGLSIVRRLVKLLGLDIQVQSSPGRGSIFSLKLRAGARAACALITAPAVAPPLASTGARHILVVEDDPGVRNATRVFLKAEGFRVTAVASLDEALQSLKRAAHIDLILSDYHLGSAVTGLEVVGALRRTLGSTLPVILITGDTSTAVSDLEREHRLKVTRKPINPQALRELIDSLLRS